MRSGVYFCHYLERIACPFAPIHEMKYCNFSSNCDNMIIRWKHFFPIAFALNLFFFNTYSQSISIYYLQLVCCIVVWEKKGVWFHLINASNAAKMRIIYSCFDLQWVLVLCQIVYLPTELLICKFIAKCTGEWKYFKMNRLSIGLIMVCGHQKPMIAEYFLD